MNRDQNREPNARTKENAHDVSDFVLDAVRLDVAGPEKRAAFAADKTAPERARALDRAADDFLSSPRSRALVNGLAGKLPSRTGAVTRRRWTLRWPSAAFGAGALAAAAATLLIVFAPERAPERRGDEIVALEPAGSISLKGTLAVEAFARRGERVVALQTGDRLAAGDAVGFRVTPGADTHVALFGTDGDAAVALVPADGGAAFAAPAGQPSQLPGSALLDGVGSEERFALVSCPQPFGAGAALSALEAWARGDEPAESALTALGAGCRLTTLSYPKAITRSR